MADDTGQLQAAIRADFDQDNRPDVTDRVVNEVKCSIVFQYSWEDLLQAGPVALTCLGSCFIATASNTSRSLTLEPPKGGFQYLKQSSLDANLIDSIDLGRLAFLTAEKNMGFVKDVATKIDNKVADVMDTLMDPQTAKTQLMPQLNSIKAGADDCYEKAKEIDSDFDKWLEHAMELHAACVQTQSSTDEQIYETQLNMAVAQNRFSAAQDSVKFAKGTADKFGKQVDLASEAYKKASDEFPSGWDILGQQVVGALADTLTTALGQLVTSYANNLNPVAQAESGVGAFNELIHSVPSSCAPPAKQSTVPAYSTDPAYAEIKTDIPYFSLINAVLTKGQDGGVNWDMASGTDAGGSGKSIYVALAMLKDAQGRFQQLATSDEPSSTLKSAFDTAITVATAMQTEVDKSTDTAHKFPDGTSDVVKGWQKSFADAYTSANKLAAVAGNLPGAARAPVMSNNTEDPAVTVSKTNAKSAQAQAELDAAKNRLATTQQHLMATQELYQQASQSLIDQQGKLGEIQADVTRLGQTNVGLEEIKPILIQCIELMVQLKQQIMNLCQFFAAVSGAIEAVTKYTVTPFIDQITDAVAGEEGKKMGNYTLTDLTRTLIYQAVITVRAYFSVFSDIATMWVQLSTANIMPGLAMVDDMMLQRGDLEATKEKAAKLQAWSLQAQQAVKDISAAQRKQILDSMQQRVADIQSVKSALPAAPAAQKAIEEGAGAVLRSARDAQRANAAAAPTNHFGMTRVAVA